MTQTFLMPDTKTWEKAEGIPLIRTYMPGEDTFFLAENERIKFFDGKKSVPLSDTAINNLGKFIDFPGSFVAKLPASLAAEVIEERRKKSVNDRFCFSSLEGNTEDEERITTVLPSWREIVQPQKYVSSVRNFHSKIPLFVNEPIFHFDQNTYKTVVEGTMILKQDVTRNVGDTLEYGYIATLLPGFYQDVCLSVKRLVCLNGMTTNETVFSWKARSYNTELDQLTWANQHIIMVANAAPAFTEKAQIMANTIVENPELALHARIKAMGLTKYTDEIFDAFDQERGSTEWALLNAFTRFATHNPDLAPNVSRNIQSAAGDWVSGFDQVTARLPRKIAISVSADIIVEDDLDTNVNN